MSEAAAVSPDTIAALDRMRFEAISKRLGAVREIVAGAHNAAIAGDGRALHVTLGKAGLILCEAIDMARRLGAREADP